MTTLQDTNFEWDHNFETRVIIFNSPFDILVTTILLSIVLSCVFCGFYYVCKKIKRLRREYAGRPLESSDSNFDSNSVPVSRSNDISIFERLRNARNRAREPSNGNGNGNNNQNEHVTIDVNDEFTNSRSTTRATSPRYEKVRGPKDLYDPLHSPLYKIDTPKSNVRAMEFSEIVPVPTPPMEYLRGFFGIFFACFLDSAFILSST